MDISTLKNMINNIYYTKEKTITFLLSLISITFAHYAGFLSSIPLPIVAAAGADLALGVTATFTFYISLCAILSKIISYIIMTLVSPVVIALYRAECGFKLLKFNQKRKYIENYKRYLKNENWISIVLQLIVFIIAIKAIYFEFEFTIKSISISIIGFIFIIISGLLKANFFLSSNLKSYKKRIRIREKEKINAIHSFLLTSILTLLLISYISGVMREEMLANAAQQQITNKYFCGYASLIASSGDSVLILEKEGKLKRYMYLTKDYGMATGPKSFQLLGNKDAISNNCQPVEKMQSKN